MDAERRGEGLDPEMVFRAVRGSILDDYERDLDRHRTDWGAQQSIGRRVNAQVRGFLERSNLDLSGADALVEAERREMHRYLDEAQARFVAREARRSQRSREEAERALGRLQTGWSPAYLIGADVLTSAPERYEGDVGNPATWLYEANTSWKGKISISGEAGCLHHWHFHPEGTIWYYAWPATAPGRHTVEAWLWYRGFRVMYAVPLPFDFCAYTGAHVTAGLKVYQQVGYPTTYSKLLGQEEANIFDAAGVGLVSSGPVDGAAKLTTSVDIDSASRVFIAVTWTMNVGAGGLVSYSELNFQDGSANYVTPPAVSISG